MKGRKVYHPALLLGILCYGYFNGISSSRKLERECRRDIKLQWLGQCLVPAHKTLANFRKDHGQTIQQFTRQFTDLLRQAGYISGHTLTVDGSKLWVYASESYTVATLRDKFSDTDRKLAMYVDQLQVQDAQDEQIDLLEERRDRLLARIGSLKAKRENWATCQAAAQQKPAKRISPTDVKARIMKGRQEIITVTIYSQLSIAPLVSWLSIM
ncbi:MAG: transposase [Bacteroidota bacterium]